MKYLKILCLLFFLGFSFLSGVNTGKISGTILSKKNGKPIPNVTIFSKKSHKATTSNMQGKFILKDLKTGKQIITVQLIGYKTKDLDVLIKKDVCITEKIYLEKEAIQASTINVSAERDNKSEIPISVKTISFDEIQTELATQDFQELIEETSGVFVSKNGVGSSDLKIRGFGKDKIQVIVNGIPVNNPVNQEVNWENWAGISSTVKNINVQKGSGTSLYGSSSFGGSINIETMGVSPDQQFTLTNSYANYSTNNKVKDSEGSWNKYNPLNYNTSLKFNSGNLFNGKLNYSILAEYKKGQYYLYKSNYEGYTLNLETQHILGDHVVKTSFLLSPQKTENQIKQAYNRSDYEISYKSDPNLYEKLGREYNRAIGEDNKNEFFKPVFSIRDEYEINPFQKIRTNAFFTYGEKSISRRNGSYINVDTGDLYYKDPVLEEEEPLIYTGKIVANYASFLHQNYNLSLPGLDYDEFSGTYKYEYKEEDYYEFENDIYNFLYGNNQNNLDHFNWISNEQERHIQYGANLSYYHSVSEDLEFTIGSDLRNWQSNNYMNIKNLRIYDHESENQIHTISNFQKAYDIDIDIQNISLYFRSRINPIDNLGLFLDGQYSLYFANVNENPIEAFNFNEFESSNQKYKTTEDLVDKDGNNVFKSSDYEKKFKYLAPRFGLNYLITENMNVFINTSAAYKEPTVFQWYDYQDGPDGPQTYTKSWVDQNSSGNWYTFQTKEDYGELVPEIINTAEIGYGYNGSSFSLNLTGYYSLYQDKIENVTIPILNQEYYNGEVNAFTKYENLTINAGDAVHKGIEVSTGFEIGNLSNNNSISYAKFRWDKINAESMFSMSSEELEGNVVPFTPEKIATSSLFYTFEEFPIVDKLKLGFSAKWWDDYYANFQNEYCANYKQINLVWYPDSLGMKSSKLPAFKELNFHIKSDFSIMERKLSINLDINNILNKKDNYTSGIVESDHRRLKPYDLVTMVEDEFTGRDQLYVDPAPLLNVFLSVKLEL